jgi:hypothetical protein
VDVTNLLCETHKQIRPAMIVCWLLNCFIESKLSL